MLQLLALVPNSWSNRITRNEFQLSRTLVAKAKLLKSNHGILSIPELKRRLSSQRMWSKALYTFTEVTFTVGQGSSNW